MNSDSSRSESSQPQSARAIGTRAYHHAENPHATAWLVTCLAVISLCGCASQPENPAFPAASASVTGSSSLAQCPDSARIVAAAADDHGYQIQAGDQLDVAFYMNPEFNDSVMVRPDGKVTLRVVGSVQAAGLTPENLALQLDQAYLSELRTPGVSVLVKQTPSREVFVQGRVVKPGSIPVQQGMTALQAISDAGGFADDASSKSVVLIRRDLCGVPHGTKLDLEEAVNHPDSNEDAGLLPRDIIVVPRSTIGNVDLFVEQYIRGVLPIQPYATLPL